MTLVVLSAAIVGGIFVGRGRERSPGALPATATPKIGALAPSLTPSIEAPTDLKLVPALAPFSVTLSWAPPPGPGEVVTYKIYRDGTRIARISWIRTSLIDTEIGPGSYTYTVTSVGEGGIESDRVSGYVLVPVPRLSRARLNGVFAVSVEPESQYGYGRRLMHFDLQWLFYVHCPIGPCDVTWRDNGLPQFEATLQRKGRHYSGSDDGEYATCGAKAVTTTMTVDLVVTKAVAVDGQWDVEEFEGTLTEEEEPELGCVASGATYSISATNIVQGR